MDKHSSHRPQTDTNRSGPHLQYSNTTYLGGSCTRYSCDSQWSCHNPGCSLSGENNNKNYTTNKLWNSPLDENILSRFCLRPTAQWDSQWHRCRNMLESPHSSPHSQCNHRRRNIHLVPMHATGPGSHHPTHYCNTDMSKRANEFEFPQAVTN